MGPKKRRTCSSSHATRPACVVPSRVGISLAFQCGQSVKRGKRLGSLEVASTVFAVLLPRLQFEVPYPMVVAFLVICVAAWTLIVVDLRRRQTAMQDTTHQINQSEFRV